MGNCIVCSLPKENEGPYCDRCRQSINYSGEYLPVSEQDLEVLATQSPETRVAFFTRLKFDRHYVPCTKAWAKGKFK